MKLAYLLGILIMTLMVTLPAGEAMLQAPSKFVSGTATKNIPLKYVDKKINPGTTYVIYLNQIIVQNNKPRMLADMTIEEYDKNGKLQAKYPPWQAAVRWSIAFNGGKGPTFTVLRIEPARCLPRSNRCTEDAVVLNVS